MIGVVGLAVAQRLSKIYPNKSTFLAERHEKAGEETRCASPSRGKDNLFREIFFLILNSSSRNSEVIHAG
jgi:L-2-hydroxyglutarate oxidase LhgO